MSHAHSEENLRVTGGDFVGALYLRGRHKHSQRLAISVGLPV